MSRNLMPKSGAMAPYIVVNRDAAVAGVFSIDGEAGAVVLTSKYLQISKYNLDQQALATRLTGIDSSIQSNTEAIGNINTAIGSINSSLSAKAAKGANNDITELNALTKAITVSQGGTGATSPYGARLALELNHLTKSTDVSYMGSPDGSKLLYISNEGAWGVTAEGGGTNYALPITHGGTGALSAAEALVKLMDGKPLPLAADGQAPYDAVTVRQLSNISGGGNASMSGVMNNFIGAVEWFNGNRTKLPAGYIPADGQLVSRTDTRTRDLWSAVSGGLFYAVSDALWISSGDPVRPYAWRASYSTGDGSTTFRIPDLNGTQLNSLKHLFLSGSSGATNEPSANQVWAQSSPNMVGSFPTAIASQFELGMNRYSERFGLPGVFGAENSITTAPDGSHKSQSVTGDNPYGITFNAAFASKTYGRGPAYQTDPGGTGPIGDLYPNHATGIWIIRANGSFNAAGSQYHVINGDSTRPADGTTTYGGFAHSDYRIGETVNHSALIVSAKRFGNPYSVAVLQSYNNETGDLANLEVQSNGVVNLPTSINNKSWIKAFGANGLHLDAATTAQDLHTMPGGGCGVSQAERNAIELNNNPGAVGSGGYVNWLQGWWYDDRFQFGAIRSGSTVLDAVALSTYSNALGLKQWFFRANDGRIASTAGTIAIEGSDIKLKENIVRAPEGALDRITKITPREFDWKAGGRHDRGYIAQELRDVDPTYVYSSTVGEGEEVLNVSTSALISDLIAAVTTLKQELDSAKLEIKKLKAK
ncbi:tail fiber protein [Salmonella phage S132]|uniref:Tail fiber protein n=1 Tax=Salmonella phage S132 TaxID=2231355 RepID=A0A2Z5HP68_9CAUD|nr:tail fiber protein [Salmonella phage S132]AXC41793.1 tail fiber protein [Salmonella phage S132]